MYLLYNLQRTNYTVVCDQAADKSFVLLNAGILGEFSLFFLVTFDVVQTKKAQIRLEFYLACFMFYLACRVHFLAELTIISQFQASSQKFAMGGCFGGLGAEPPALKNFAFFLQK